MSALTSALPAVSAAFAASLVEVVEAFTIVLAVGSTRGWRAAWVGTGAALALLAGLVAAIGPALLRMPIHALQLVVGVLLLLFGLGWLRKAILRAGGVLALRDEAVLYERATRELGAESSATAPAAASGTAGGARRRLDWIGVVTVFKAVLLEGLEVAFTVLAVGAGHDLIAEASLGAAAACALVLVIGMALRRPLARVPENGLKFCVGVLLTAFGVYWSGEGLSLSWPGAELALLGLIALFAIVGLGTASLLRQASVQRESRA
ncbi:MAG: TMEM165/GDT1 family protein [Mitsuaria chitosanitabida]|uniref:TMEM165/GDT1 family protein n=1 Tax=Roseateles chitosanitabidus TaxID=65048 RepID=UPI001B050FD0|nr:TMEM165/GDT1 family protein [Roseateles chitosanitabidus]MBO9687898.1 TMEM165/GDT1 family protein [Roseateles chitosanitabidus]